MAARPSTPNLMSLPVAMVRTLGEARREVRRVESIVRLLVLRRVNGGSGHCKGLESCRWVSGCAYGLYLVCSYFDFVQGFSSCGTNESRSSWTEVFVSALFQGLGRAYRSAPLRHCAPRQHGESMRHMLEVHTSEALGWGHTKLQQRGVHSSATTRRVKVKIWVFIALSAARGCGRTRHRRKGHEEGRCSATVMR